MPQIQIQSGDNLSTLAQAHGTSVQAIMAANPGITDPNKIFAGRTLNIPDAPATGGPTGGPGGTAIGGTNTDNPLGGNTTAAPGMMTSLSSALREALDEAATAKKASRIKALSGNMPAGSDPNVISAAIGLANSGVQSGENQTYKDTMDAVQVAQKNSLDLLKTFASDGSLANMPDSSLMAMSKAAGLDEGTALAWKAKIAASNKQSDQAKAAALQNVQLEIQTKQKALTEGPKTTTDQTLADATQIKGVKDFYGLDLGPGTTKGTIKNIDTAYNALKALKASGKSRSDVEAAYTQQVGPITDNIKGLLDKLYPAAAGPSWWQSAITNAESAVTLPWLK